MICRDLHCYSTIDVSTPWKGNTDGVAGLEGGEKHQCFCFKVWFGKVSGGSGEKMYQEEQVLYRSNQKWTFLPSPRPCDRYIVGIPNKPLEYHLIVVFSFNLSLALFLGMYMTVKLKMFA